MTKIEQLKKSRAIDLFVTIFTSVALAFVEYILQADEPNDAEASAQRLFNILFDGPKKTLGLLADE